MSKELSRARHRQMLIFLLVCVGMLTLLARLYYWQVLQSQGGRALAKLADVEHTQSQVVDAPRGIIYDIHGHILATNIIRDDVYIEPIQFSVDHPDTTQSDLTSLVNALHSVLPTVSVERLMQDFSLNAGAVRIAVRIDPTQSEQLRKMHLPDVFLEPRTWRTYPAGNLAAQVVGFVRQDDKNENIYAGQYGIEAQYNTLLAGKPGRFTAETDLSGNPLVVGDNAAEPAVNGANLTLTIDSVVQYQVQAALAKTIAYERALGGTAVVLDTRTGAVVAMAGAPSFDPNQFGQYAGQLGCLSSEGVFFNPALFCAYEPGSTMKPITMAAALDQGLITPDTAFSDPGYISFDDAPTVKNWQSRAYGTETMTQVLEHSANVGAAYVAHDILGAGRYYPYLASFGFGQAFHIAGAEEAGSYRIPSVADWTASDLTRQSFGQSILVTPLQLAVAYAAIANGGVMMRPYVVAAVDTNGQVKTTQPQMVRRVISAQTAQELTGMLMQAALYGSAQLAQVQGYSVAAKTGTATTQGISADQTEASVAGFIPATNPRFVILVKIDRPQLSIYGSTAAAPLWKEIAQQLMEYYQIPPDRTSNP